MQKQNVDQACPYNPSCLGMCEWTDCPGAKVNASLRLPSTSKFEPHPTASKFEPHPTASTFEPHPTASKSATASKRFEFADEETLEKFSKGLTPANTGWSTKWALKVFELWQEERNKRFPGDKVPEDFQHSRP